MIVGAYMMAVGAADVKYLWSVLVVGLIFHLAGQGILWLGYAPVLRGILEALVHDSTPSETYIKGRPNVIVLSKRGLDLTFFPSFPIWRSSTRNIPLEHLKIFEVMALRDALPSGCSPWRSASVQLCH